MVKIINFLDEICHQDRDAMIERALFGTAFDFSFRQYSSWEGVGWIVSRMSQLGYEASLMNKNGTWSCYFNKNNKLDGFISEKKNPWDAVIECALFIKRSKENE